jgi:hypothetical protein
MTGKNALRLSIVALFVLSGAVTWASSGLTAQQSSAPQWHPRKAPAGAQFVGDQVCASCHKKIVAQLQPSAMSMAMEPVADSKVLADNPSMTFRKGPYTYTIKRQGRQSAYTVTDGKDTVTVPILYAFGQGKAGQTYVLQYDGAYYESLVSFYNEVRGLDFTIGAARTVPESLEKAIGRRLPDREVSNCFSCHSTGGVVGGKLNLEKMAVGIRCEACHGPGAAHVAAIKAGDPNTTAIYNPGKLSGDQISQEFCASCHRGTDEFSLLQTMAINNIRFQPYRIFHSKCYSDDRRISCTACHNPHEPLRREAAYYDSKCLACHATNGKTALVDVHAKAPAPDAPACKVATKDCVTCHMPKIGPEAAHFKFTDHYIRVVKPGETYPN